MSERIQWFAEIPLENWIMAAIAVVLWGAFWAGKAAILALFVGVGARAARRGWDGKKK